MRLFLTCLVLTATAFAAEPVPVHKANYELAQHWMQGRVGKLVFDMSVTPHWLAGDKFWYSYETSHGRHFYIVDPAKKTKAPVFDNAKMAAMLTEITRVPYDSQHLPIRTIKFIKNDTAIEFEVQVERDAFINGKQTVLGVVEETDATTTGGQNEDAAYDNAPQQRGGRGGGVGLPPNPRMRTLYFEYDLASMKLTLPTEYTPEPKRPLWASISPDEKWIVFARKEDLYMMDAASYALALKRADDPNIRKFRSPKMAKKISATRAASTEPNSSRSNSRTSRKAAAQSSATRPAVCPRSRFIGRRIPRASPSSAVTNGKWPISG